jgi:hypothetical protein
VESHDFFPSRPVLPKACLTICTSNFLFLV